MRLTITIWLVPSFAKYESWWRDKMALMQHQAAEPYPQEAFRRNVVIGATKHILISANGHAHRGVSADRIVIVDGADSTNVVVSLRPGGEIVEVET